MTDKPRKLTDEQKELIRIQPPHWRYQLEKEGVTLEEALEFKRRDVLFHRIALGVGLPTFLGSSLFLIYAIFNKTPPKNPDNNYHLQQEYTISPVESLDHLYKQN